MILGLILQVFQIPNAVEVSPQAQMKLDFVVQYCDSKPDNAISVFKCAENQAIVICILIMAITARILPMALILDLFVLHGRILQLWIE